jgi:phosphatidate phosphatase APP1
MANWKKVLLHLANDAEYQFDRLKYRFHERYGYKQPVMIQTYRGYGTEQKVYIKGRVLEDKGIRSALENDTLWDNLVNMYKRFDSTEIPYAQVRARFQGQEQTITANEEGFFDIWLTPSGTREDHQLWQQVQLELVAPLRPEESVPQATGEILVPPPDARFGVISDIDDTIVQTDAAHLLHMARTVFLGNARTRLPFKGAAAFYRALFNGRSGQEANPLFYVSSSPWNLYDLFSDFFHLQEIPIGPVLFLRDWGLTENEILPVKNRAFKLSVCKEILDFYTHLPFILVGDSGQEDPEIYRELVDLYPKRILAIYIRNVSRKLARPKAIEKLAEEVVAAGSILILAKDTLPLARHAIAQGWISAAAFPEIQAEKKAAEAQPTPVEKLLGEKPAPADQGPTPTVVIEGENQQETRQEVKKGAIQDVLKKEGKKEEEKPGEEKPPTIVVKGKEEPSPKEEPPE